MPNAAELIKVFKKIANEANDAKKPVEVCFGKVQSVAPLKILVDQKLLLEAKQLILSRDVTDYQIDITTLAWLTENRSGGGGDAAFASHNHDIIGRKSIIVHNALIVGDEVILIREQGGQRYIVIDRVGKMT